MQNNSCVSHRSLQHLRPMIPTYIEIARILAYKMIMALNNKAKP